ncbi:antiterminator Q family protein [Lonepinella koalarum]|uniref:Antitermination protein Q n=1 Tax=Lonepinella koalarum TaxID=53417 RepID=A0A4R1KXK8_9PAST|nr:antiterminator Q family protein [Lonepinella koalarum]MDH2927921.1 hypothetical protein [Lonepinella koalarum]TCK70118.1 hypothetical protein EV692_1344 [Lonepinella koalarum]TFJ90287.1 hypothetical protein E0709_02810 [Lonepinella koalarum]
MSFKDVCIQWGYWATPRLGTEYPSLSVSIPVPPVMKSKRVVPIKDELAMEIDRCVCVMKKVTPELYDLFMATYAYRLPVYDLRNKYKVVTQRGILTRFGVSKAHYFNLMRVAETSLKLMLSQNQCIMLA